MLLSFGTSRLLIPEKAKSKSVRGTFFKRSPFGKFSSPGFTFTIIFYPSNTAPMTLAEFLEKLHTNSATELMGEVYHKEQNVCVGYLVKNGVAKELARDIYTDALIVLCEKAGAGKIEPSVTKVSTYLVQVCQNMMLGLHQKNEKERMAQLFGIQPDTDTDENLETTVLLLRQCLAIQKDATKQLIDYWLDGVSHEEIARRMSYSNANTSKARFWQVLQSLRKCIEGRRNQSDN